MSPLLKTIGMGFFAAVAGGFLSSAMVSGAIYSWIDTGGVKHFSNVAPPENSEALERLEDKVKPPRKDQFKVVKIFDGDTVQVEGFGLQFTIRLVGIDTPELGRKGQKSQPYGKEAKQELTRLIDKKTIALKQYGTGGYNRVLAEIFVGAANLNLEMVRSGFAEVYRGKRPDGFDAALYLEAEKSAKHSLKGMWVQGAAYKSPGQWRREHPFK
jgi:micrococcal nuclease